MLLFAVKMVIDNIDGNHDWAAANQFECRYLGQILFYRDCFDVTSCQHDNLLIVCILAFIVRNCTVHTCIIESRFMFGVWENVLHINTRYNDFFAHKVNMYPIPWFVESVKWTLIHLTVGCSYIDTHNKRPYFANKTLQPSWFKANIQR